MRGKDSKEMRLVSAGWFEMGSSDQEIEEAYELAKRFHSSMTRAELRSETPRHRVWSDAFYMDIYEVTLGEYKMFVEQTNHRRLPDWVAEYAPSERHPVIGVAWEDADAYCQWANKQLPTEAQWEKAARGEDGRQYPWGNQAVSGEYANYLQSSGIQQHTRGWYTKPVGSYESGKSPYGIYDLAGNVWEWTQDWYDRDYYIKSPAHNPINDHATQHRVVRGGSWDSSPVFLRASYRSWRTPESWNDFIGFRCVIFISSPGN
jgi:formylglycine-generating enzyme required for sulfatase activity